MVNKDRLSRERGQSLVLVAAALVVLVMFVAVAVDLSNAYYARRTAQNGADGAALAGASRLSAGINEKKNPNLTKLDHDIQVDMNDFAQRNGVEDTNDDLADAINDNVDGWYVDVDGNRIVINGIEIMVGSGEVPEEAAGVEAIAHVDADAYFGGIFGVAGYPLQARAVSQIRLACGSDCLVPMVTQVDLLMDEDGQPNLEPCYHIWKERVLNEKGEEVISQGTLGWVSWTWQESVCSGLEDCEPERPCPRFLQGNGCAATLLENNLNHDFCASGFVQVGDWVAAAPGDMSKEQVRCQLDYYLDYDDPYNDCTDDKATSFTVPVYDVTTANYPVGNPYQSSPPSNCGPMPDPCNPYVDSNSYVVHYRVAGLARMQLLQYQLSEGEGATKYPPDDQLDQATLDRIASCISYYDFDCDPIADPINCDLDNKKKKGFRITVEFLEYVQDFSSSDSCYDPLGTLWASPKLTQ